MSAFYQIFNGGAVFIFWFSRERAMLCCSIFVGREKGFLSALSTFLAPIRESLGKFILLLKMSIPKYSQGMEETIEEV